MTDNIENLRKRATAAMDSVSDSARETAVAAKERIAAAYGTARQQSDQLAGKARDTAQNAIKHGRENATSVIAKGKIKGAEVVHKAGSQVQDYPLATLAGAIVAGVLVGLALPKRGRRKNDAGPDA